jgi:hypothetical protein
MRLEPSTQSLARAEMSKEELAKLSQNPVASLISVPFQNNTNFHYGPLDETQNILNIEPVIPVTLNKDWNLITRTIFPTTSSGRTTVRPSSCARKCSSCSRSKGDRLLD